MNDQVTGKNKLISLTKQEPLSRKVVGAVVGYGIFAALMAAMVFQF